MSRFGSVNIVKEKMIDDGQRHLYLFFIIDQQICGRELYNLFISIFLFLKAASMSMTLVIRSFNSFRCLNLLSNPSRSSLFTSSLVQNRYITLSTHSTSTKINQYKNDSNIF